MNNMNSKKGDTPLIQRPCPICCGQQMRVHFTYSEPPPLEYRFKCVNSQSYWRELHRCEQCGHYYEWHEMDQSKLYEEDYVTATYGDEAEIYRAFNKINALPPEKSDNIGRVNYIIKYSNNIYGNTKLGNVRKKLLDVGCGLGVFPYRMKQENWEVTAIDLDSRLVKHANEAVGIIAKQTDVITANDLGYFDLITFNKVLEHVENPVEMLTSVSRLLNPDGLVYVELPDGEGAEIEGKDREEYLLGHIHVFSAASYAHLVMRAGFSLLTFERLREPSGKFTLRGLISL